MFDVRLAMLIAALGLVVPAGASLQFAVSPTHLEEGVQDPGSTFYGDFRVLSSEKVEIDIRTERGSLRDFNRFKSSKSGSFSAQSCAECVEMLRGEGAIEEQDQELSAAGSEFVRWKDVKFLVNIPGDMEPGYHVLLITPDPDIEGSGSLSLLSTSSFPVIFRVPGEVTRSGKIIGLRPGSTRLADEKLVASFYNNGTATMEVETRFKIEGENSTEDIGRDEKVVPPGETRKFSTSVPAGREEFKARVAADYGTGEVSETADISLKESVRAVERRDREEKGMPISTVILLFLLAVMSFVVWKVVQDG
ncbi:MAG: hypothetical protein MUP63_00865 [Candidatus Nanohaloarchaeota archaeon QJJ-7]|nr:hypothetical protein [Candidatus Nanohaloarchaeota archaeon QJJ-7]